MRKAPASAPTRPKDNHLLAALPEAAYEKLVASLEPVTLPLGLSVYEPGAAQEYVWFPTDGIV